jgi:GNAT superfamily N-acetyltransferase
MADAAPIYEEGFHPGYLGRMIQMQGEYYDVIWPEPNMNFELMMARQICDFREGYNPDRDLLLTVHIDDQLAGYLAVIGNEKERPGARLRWFLVEEKYRGRGIGRELLRRALNFCRQAGFKTAWLWTMENLEKAQRLYAQAGFKPTADTTVSMPLHGIILETTLV